MVIANKNLVDAKKGLLDRRIFADESIYQQELEQVFGRSWLFVGHESQIASNNDFVSNYMAEDPVLVTRDAKGKLHTFLNMCRHRGNRICRADQGNAQSFMCTYHGWTFATDGKLVGVPGYKEAYFEELDRSQWGLVEARTDSYKGLIFANWDNQAPSLLDYLGDMAWYLDIVLDSSPGGTEIVGGVLKGVVNCNWKMPTDNFAGDGYHFPLTHGSIEILRRDPQYASLTRHWRNPTMPSQQDRLAQRQGTGGQVTAGNGHTIGVNSSGYATWNPSDPLPGNPASRYFVQRLPESSQRLGDFRAVASIGSLNVFPNLSYSSSFRLWHPRGPLKIESWGYIPVDKAAPKEIKEAIRVYEVHMRSPNGFVEIDDLDNYIACSYSGRLQNGKPVPMNLQLKLGHEQPFENIPGNGTAGGVSESNQRSFYARWAEMMNASSWGDIKLDAKTK